MKNKSIQLPFETKNNKWWRFINSNWIYSLVKNRSVELPFLTKNSKKKTSWGNKCSWFITSNGIYALVKNKGVKLPSLTKNKNILLHLHTRTKQLPLPNILWTLKLEATICDLSLNLFVVKNESIKLPFVTWKKYLLPFVYYWLMSYFKTLIPSHHYTETTQCILCNCHNPLRTELKLTNRQHTRQSLLFNH